MLNRLKDIDKHTVGNVVVEVLILAVIVVQTFFIGVYALLLNSDNF